MTFKLFKDKLKTIFLNFVITYINTMFTFNSPPSRVAPQPVIHTVLPGENTCWAAGKQMGLM